MKDRLNFTTDYYFPGRFTWGAVLVLAAVAFVAADYYIIAGISLLGGVLAITTRYGVEVDFSARQYQEYTWVLGLKIGQRISFDGIKYLFIKDFKITQTFNSRVNSATITKDEYRGYVKFNDQERVHIVSHEDYDLLVAELKVLARQFNVGLIDYSFGHHTKLA